ncbi:MAG: radical SAM protein [Deltaproteobacteria bacterium]|nr:radical SAM protein [Deltaproteobacteria bacterium]
MRNIEINIGMVCNNRCVFCVNSQVNAAGRRWVSKERVVAEIDRAAARGYRALGFLGGEITYYPHAVEVIRLAREKGFVRISLCTNGRRLARKEILDALIEAGVTRFAVSIHSHEADVEDRICGRKGAFGEKLAGIDNLVRAAAEGHLRDGVSLNSCIHGLNWNRLTEMARFFRARGISDMRFNFLRPEHQAEGNRELVPRLSDALREVLRLVVENHRRLRMTITFGDIPVCLWPPSFLANAAFARRYIGEFRDLDTDVSEFRDAVVPHRFNWRRTRSATLKARLPVCGACGAAGICEGPWTKYVALHGADEFRAVALAKGAKEAKGAKGREVRAKGAKDRKGRQEGGSGRARARGNAARRKPA